MRIKKLIFVGCLVWIGFSMASDMTIESLATSLLDGGIFPRAREGYDESGFTLDQLVDFDGTWRRTFPEAESFLDFYASDDGAKVHSDSGVIKTNCNDGLWFAAFSYFFGDDLVTPGDEVRIHDSVLTAIRSLNYGALPKNRLIRWLVAAHVLEVAEKNGFDSNGVVLGVTEIITEVVNSNAYLAINQQGEIVSKVRAIIAFYHPEGIPESKQRLFAPAMALADAAAELGASFGLDVSQGSFAASAMRGESSLAIAFDARDKYLEQVAPISARQGFFELPGFTFLSENWAEFFPKSESLFDWYGHKDFSIERTRNAFLVENVSSGVWIHFLSHIDQARAIDIAEFMQGLACEEGAMTYAFKAITCGTLARSRLRRWFVMAHLVAVKYQAECEHLAREAGSVHGSTKRKELADRCNKATKEVFQEVRNSECLSLGESEAILAALKLIPCQHESKKLAALFVGLGVGESVGK